MEPIVTEGNWVTGGEKYLSLSHMQLAIVKEQGEFGWIMSTVIHIVIALDYHSAVILDGETMTVATMKMWLYNVPILVQVAKLEQDTIYQYY